jgi:hypothetical protein
VVVLVLYGSSAVAPRPSVVASLVGSSAGVLSDALGSSGSVVSPALDAGGGRSGVNIVGDLVPLWVEESNDATSPRSMVLGVRRESVVRVMGMFRIRSGSVFRKLSIVGVKKISRGIPPISGGMQSTELKREPACQFQDVPFA